MEFQNAPNRMRALVQSGVHARAQVMLEIGGLRSVHALARKTGRKPLKRSIVEGRSVAVERDSESQVS